MAGSCNKKVLRITAFVADKAKILHSQRVSKPEKHEKDYRRLILDDYTFLKRPVVLIGREFFAGSEKKTVEGLKAVVR